MALASCLCVSKGRPYFLKKAIQCYRSQTYHKKELIIVSDEYSDIYEKVIASFNDKTIKYFPYESGGRSLTQGELRNISIEKATGRFMCVWDDDDWYHCQRLEMQIRHATENGKGGSILPYCLLFNAVRQQAYFSAPFMPPGSILFEKKLIENTVCYPAINKEEDYEFLKEIYKTNILFPLIHPLLYVYLYHGKNTTEDIVFESQFKGGQALSAKHSQLIAKVFQSSVSPEMGSKLLEGSDIRAEVDYFKVYY